MNQVGGVIKKKIKKKSKKAFNCDDVGYHSNV